MTKCTNYILGNLYFLVKGYIYLRSKFWPIELFFVRKSILFTNDFNKIMERETNKRGTKILVNPIIIIYLSGTVVVITPVP
jgi:hypothetical protein